jgi:hypothetical protein
MLTPIGNLRDLLAGDGSLPCDGGFPDPTGNADFVVTPDDNKCGGGDT